MQPTATFAQVRITGPIYLDCNATTPIEPAVLEEMHRLWSAVPGNAGSRTHEYGLQAKKAVQRAREQVASVVCAEPEDVIFTSGATESNNISILGLAAHADSERRRHVVSTAMEHKAVLEPLKELEERGFEISLVRAWRVGHGVGRCGRWRASSRYRPGLDHACEQ